MSRFLKCTRMRSPSRARISGPGIPSLSPEPGGRLRIGRFQFLRVAAVDDRAEDGLRRVVADAHDRVALVGDRVPAHGDRGHPVVPRGGPAAGAAAEAAAPSAIRAADRGHDASLDRDLPVHERVDHAVEVVLPRRPELDGVAGRQRRAAAVSMTPEFQNPLPCSAGVSVAAVPGGSLGRRPAGRRPAQLKLAAICPR